MTSLHVGVPETMDGNLSRHMQIGITGVSGFCIISCLVSAGKALRPGAHLDLVCAYLGVHVCGRQNHVRKEARDEEGGGGAAGCLERGGLIYGYRISPGIFFPLSATCIILCGLEQYGTLLFLGFPAGQLLV